MMVEKSFENQWPLFSKQSYYLRNRQRPDWPDGSSAVLKNKIGEINYEKSISLRPIRFRGRASGARMYFA